MTATGRRGPNWSKGDVLLLEELIRRGWSDERIGHRLGRTPQAVNRTRKSHGIPSRQRAMLSAQHVARLLGMPCSKRVARWLRHGWLRGRLGQGCGPNRQWYIERRELLAFLADPAYWPLWDPELIRQPSLKAWALKRRGRRDGRYITTRQAGQALGLVHRVVSDYVRRGLLPAVRHGNWLIRETDVRGFVPLCDRPRIPVQGE